MPTPPTAVFIVEGEAQIPASGADIVLMDVRLAGTMDGIETAARLHGLTDAATIFQTACSDDDLPRRAGAVEAHGLPSWHRRAIFRGGVRDNVAHFIKQPVYSGAADAEGPGGAGLAGSPHRTEDVEND